MECDQDETLFVFLQQEPFVRREKLLLLHLTGSFSQSQYIFEWNKTLLKVLM